jgi:flavin-dependent dehydrogenase
MESVDMAVIGGGVVGLAAARAIARNASAMLL